MLWIVYLVCNIEKKRIDSRNYNKLQNIYEEPEGILVITFITKYCNWRENYAKNPRYNSK